MARTPIAVTNSSKAGTLLPAATAADVSNGNSIAVDDKTMIIVANTGVTSRTVTITPSVTVDGLAVADRTITLASGVSRLLGPYPASTYGTTLLITGSHAELTFRPVRVIGA